MLLSFDRALDTRRPRFRSFDTLRCRQHALPSPKMVLRYTDGRPDVPIPAPTLKRGGSKLRPTGTSRSHTIPHHDRPRTGSHAAPHVPEEIRILPAPDASIPPQPRSHARSKSLPRNAHAEPVPDMPIPGLPGPVPLSGRAPMVTFSQQPGPQWHPHSQGHRNAPPSIVYAPSHHRSHPHYAPPVIFSHPPKVGPDGVIYSHSAPVPANYGQSYHPTPYPSVGSDERHTAERHSRSRTPHPEASRSRHRHKEEMRPVSPPSSSSSLSDGSGSTYYVLPTGRQKVHVIHTPDTSASSGHRSHRRADSHSSKSPTSPHSPNSPKKPLFQRLLGAGQRLFSTSSGDGAGSSSSQSGSVRGKRLQRRHSTGTRSQSVPPAERPA
ncbi:unnamed protein product [Mycena citricolor]|uniref:Uncharacterized protein n=1 Tax=Mycena citricolor TaxID=2018698 RepID=A0AAD2HMF9_9AGAR|nr:unnamed protein product [Mycena citricolor]